MSATLAANTEVQVSPAAGKMDCEQYLNTNWGAGSGEFGFADSHEVLIGTIGPYPIEFDETGGLYVPDQVNNRILAYDAKKVTREINLSESYILTGMGIGNTVARWFPISVSKDRIYLLHNYDKVAILSIQGRELASFDLGDHGFDFDWQSGRAISHPIISDHQGGFYIVLGTIPDILVHFDANLNTENVIIDGPLMLQWASSEEDVFYWGGLHDLIVGWDGLLYSYSRKYDSLLVWGKAGAFSLEPTEFLGGDIINSLSRELGNDWKNVSSRLIQLVGVDTKGNVFFQSWDNLKSSTLIMISPTERKGSVVEMEGRPLLSLSPNGTIFVLSLDPKNPDIQPLVLACHFE